MVCAIRQKTLNQVQDDSGCGRVLCYQKTRSLSVMLNTTPYRHAELVSVSHRIMAKQ